NRYIAPSLSLDLGARTDFTILTSYQERSYVRQQGLPLSGSINSNVNRALPRSLFIGEPGARPYAANETRVGYVLTHRFDDGWTL
ncbi:TonB-dependent siderophore receptor, partial [Acinetobacter baumannii]